jgi:hypothetical protein
VNATINALASGTWAHREGEQVEIVAVKPNGRATAVIGASDKRPAFVPTRWLTVEAPEPERCPLCGRVLEQTP